MASQGDWPVIWRISLWSTFMDWYDNRSLQSSWYLPHLQGFVQQLAYHSWHWYFRTFQKDGWDTIRSWCCSSRDGLNCFADVKPVTCHAVYFFLSLSWFHLFILKLILFWSIMTTLISFIFYSLNMILRSRLQLSLRSFGLKFKKNIFDIFGLLWIFLILALKALFFPKGNKASVEGRSPPQELEVSPRSGLYLLVYVIVIFRTVSPTKKNKKNIQLLWQFDTKYFTLFHNITGSIFLSESSTLTIAGALIFFITPPFAYTKGF